MYAKRTSEQPSADDRELLKRAQAGADGFGELFDRYYDRIYAYAYRRVGSQQAAEDIAACVFEQALRRIKHLRWQGKPIIAWLYRVASRRVADYYRDKQNRTLAEHEGTAAAVEGTESLIERAETYAVVWAGIERLEPHDREIIQLTFFDQVGATEIAAMWNSTPNNVYVRLHRALKRLKLLLEKDHGMG